MRLRIRSASIMQNKCVYKALREIDYKGWELTLKIPYLRRLESTFVMQNKSWQLTAVQPQRDRPSGICKHLYEPARGPYDYKKTPQASVNTFIDPLGEQELATDCPYFCKRLWIRYSLYVPSQDPLWHLWIPYEPARGIELATDCRMIRNTELVPNCHIITKPPLGTYKYLYRPARGIPSWHLTAVWLQRDRLSGICEYLYEPARGIQS
jgi:rubredoxin